MAPLFLFNRMNLLTRLSAAILLGSAAVFQFWTGPALHIPLAMIELLIAASLLVWYRAHLPAYGAAVLFFCFACYGGWRISRGIADCGCFGAAHVNPLHTFLSAALGTVAMLATTRTSGSRARIASHALQLCFIVFAIAAPVEAIVSHQTAPSDLAWIDRVIVETRKTIGPRMDQGSFQIAVVNPGCGHCFRFLPTLSDKPVGRYAIVFTYPIPEESDIPDLLDPDADVLMIDQLDDICTPTILELEDGKLVSHTCPDGSSDTSF